jgi:glycosyltransferase involved in cell wall biosynthesis
MLPRIALHIAETVIDAGGWLAGLSDSILQDAEIELTIAFPMNKVQSIISGKVDNLAYFGFPQLNSTEYSLKTEEYTETIIKQVNPDIVHIFGTEYPHTLAVVHTCEKLDVIDKVVINIQGLVSIYSRHYYAGLPYNIIKKNTIRDFFKQDNIKKQKKAFFRRGGYEIEALQKVRHVIGRTDWDRACTSQVNPLLQYYFCNETLRNEFYNHRWDITKCERYSIFISQAGYPIKGLHFMLEALPEIIKKYPDTRLYIAGYDITNTDSLMSKIKISSYGVYIKKLIKKYNLRKYITFTGPLNEKSMCERFLKSHVFVSPSSIENESNSISEAKMLGTPVIASFVGGVTERIEHYKTGLLYQYDAPYMLAYYVCKLFADDDLALLLSENAKKNAMVLHDKEDNLQELKVIYKKMINLSECRSS